MNSEFKVIIKPMKPKVKELDPIKIEALKEKRRLQREARKNNPVEPKEPKEPKVKPDYTQEIENINKTLKNLVGFSIDEINEKLKNINYTTTQVGLPTEPDVVPNKKSRKKSQ
ncbi:MAG: hypothetical protein ASQ68_gp17 [Yellowstone Lake virophage 6]|uniref:hypothetical protein n=1 Tax=Yellowstone Lake virophage 6 TaxID=1557034 RepID=UPI000535D447|nr:MAG: hypothetical protein ASQ68_gp17 [Yellowstone Lake virophage 6]AIW01907.1 MAG: hypothetical protein YSLV6_ORF17 [Yellowstone Lake virophage 6]